MHKYYLSGHMKILFTAIILLCRFLAAAQLVFLADDPNIKKETDGYQQGFLVDAPKSLDGILFFSTPNFRLYQSDGTAAGTKVIAQFPAGSLVYVKAVTKRFVYYTIRSGDGNVLRRLDRTTIKQEALTHYQKPLTVDPGTSSVFVSTSKDLLAVRMHNYDLGITQLISFTDNGPLDAKVVMTNLKSESSAQLTTFSDIAFLGPQIFYNGFENKQVNGKSAFEYTIQSSIPGNTQGMDYDIKNIYSLRSKGYELNDHFYTINDSLFSIGFFQNAQTNTRDLFIASIHWQTLRVPVTLPTDQNFAWGEVLDNQLYLVNGTRLLNWVPGSGKINEVYRKRTYQYQKLQPYSNLLKCGNYMVFREEDSLRTFNLQTKTFAHVAMPERFIPKNSLYKTLDHYAWTDRKHIYYMSYKGFTPSFTQYDPMTGQSAPVVFPESKNERFDSFLAIFQTEGKFLFLTKYTGKKNQPVYKMFYM